MTAYYNECDPFAAAWLRELIKAGLIADGEVDERSIADVTADDVRGFTQGHFFAGIGGWSYALRLAGWPDDREAWTGSCPCQPFSSAGAQAGGADPRDLWPTWRVLITECRPRVVFGEQVEAAIGHGWLDRLHDDLEAEGYAVGPVGLPSASIGAFDIRQRLWFVADAADFGHEWRRRPRGGRPGSAHASVWRDCDWIPCRDGKARPVEPGTFPLAHGIPARVGRLRGYGNAINPYVAAAFIEAYMSIGEPVSGLRGDPVARRG